MWVGIPCAVIVGVVLLAAVASQGHPGHYRLGSWEAMVIWRVHMNHPDGGSAVHGFGVHRRRAIARVRECKKQGKWNPGCYVSWRWEISHHGVRVRSGPLHLRGMYSTKRKDDSGQSNAAI